ncbi:hypothetical protein BKA64DRAFT_705652 [Cadophora sp. MPI-SDFR-AT-0126]|nr:hypothetical protein BKA64DRAFT_705652 [Leotiomycetes sp. MPI-SDFR-AT-0126]
MSDKLSMTVKEAAISTLVERGAFSIFLKLPLELRRIIWWFSCANNQPRLIYISKRVYQEWWRGLVARYQIPSQLQANQESRECALRYYDLAFGTQMEGMSIYFNFAIDALVFGDYQALYAFIRLWFNDDNEMDMAKTPLDKKVLAVAVLDTESYCSYRVTEAVKALGSPEYMHIITARGVLEGRDKWMENYYRYDWLRQNPKGRNGYFGPTVNFTTIKQFQTMLNILHNPKLASKPKGVTAPTRRSARLQGIVPT